MASQVLSRSVNLINGPNGHFLDLSVMFLLPLAFFLSTVVYPAIFDLYTNPFSTTISNQLFLTAPTSEPRQSQPTIPDMTIFTFFAFLLSVFVSSLLAVGSITQSAFHVLHGRPVILSTAIKSGLASFFPLLGTLLVSQVVVLLILIGFGQFVRLAVQVGELIGLEMKEGSSLPYFIFMAISVVGLIVLLLHLQVLWSLASVVVVVESCWGFGALMQSSRLVKGMRVRWVVLGLMLMYGVFSLILGLFSWVLELWSEAEGAGEWKSWAISVLLGLTTVLQMMVLLYYGVAITALYCKVTNCED